MIFTTGMHTIIVFYRRYILIVMNKFRYLDIPTSRTFNTVCFNLSNNFKLQRINICKFIKLPV